MKWLTGWLVTLVLLVSTSYAQPPEKSFHAPPLLEQPFHRGPEVGKAKGTEKSLEWLKEEFPEKYEKLMQLKEEKPHKFRMQAMRLRKRLGMLNRLKKEDPKAYEMSKELFRLEEEVRELAENYKKAETLQQRDEIKNEIQEILDEAFNLKLTLGKRRLQNLEGKLAELQEFLRNRKEHKEEIITRRLEELLKEEEEYLKW